MASFEWKKLNSKIVVSDTRKQYFNQYYCSIKYFCPGGRVIANTSSTDIREVIDFRKRYSRMSNYGGSWRYNREQLDQVDIGQLEAFRSIKNTYPTKIKFRVEEPAVIIYSEEESTIVDIATILKDWSHTIRQVTRPKNDADRVAISTGSIILKKDPGYKFKVMCKEGVCNNKSSIAAYLINLGDQVKISDTVAQSLMVNPYPYIYGIWFYTNDPDIANMLNIIEPNFVTNIHKVVVS